MKSYTYLINLFRIEPLYTGKVGRPKLVETLYALKLGKADIMGRRMKQHLMNLNYDISRIEILREYEFSSPNYSEMFESLLREYFTKKYPNDFVKNDRFEETYIQPEDLLYADLAYRMFKEDLEKY